MARDGVVIQGFSSEQERELAGQWDRRRGRLERMLTTFPAESRSLRLTVRQRPPGCEAHAVLMLPTGTLAGRGRSGEAELAIDEACDKLTSELRAHKAALRRDFLYHRRHRRRGDLSGILPALEECWTIGDQATFAALLRPALRELSDHARRELVIAELQGAAWPDNLTVSRLLGDLIARAWDRFGSRPPDQRLELWLTGLLHELLDAQSGARPGPAERNAPAAAKEGGGWGWDGGWEGGAESFWPVAESLTLADVVPAGGGGGGGSALDGASDEEQRLWILHQLRGFTREQRRAFTLYTLEGWNADEIAALQARTPEAVLLDVEHVRNELAAKLQDAEAVTR